MQEAKGKQETKTKENQTKTNKQTNQKPQTPNTQTKKIRTPQTRQIPLRQETSETGETIRTGRVKHKVYKALEQGRLNCPRSRCQGSYGLENYLD